MTYVPHARIVMSGEIGGATGEIFSMTINVAADATPSLGGGFDLDLARATDVATDCAAWFNRSGTGISNVAVLKQTKVSQINAAGKATGEIFKIAQNVAGSQLAGSCGPWQVAQKVTFHTLGDNGKVKGGFYVPCPSLVELDRGSSLWSAAAADAARVSLDLLVEAINDQPGMDSNGFVVIVASQGRRNPDGTLRVQPANYAVQSVSVGRRPDVIRRRANKVSEARGALAVITGE